MKTSKWAGLVMIAGSAMVFGCSKDAEQAANSNDKSKAVVTASTQGAGSTTQADAAARWWRRHRPPRPHQAAAP